MLLIAHPSPDVYGSDLQLVETVRGVVARGWSPVVVLPFDGPLVARLLGAGAVVRVMPFPVLRKALLRPVALLLLAVGLPPFFARALREIRRTRPQRMLVNTLTIPWWLVVARLARLDPTCHVHEAEAGQWRIIRLALALPLSLARLVIVNSAASRDVLLGELGSLAAKTVVVYNGVSQPRVTSPYGGRARGDRMELVLVGRLAPRKGTDVALDAVGLLRRQGVDARLRLCGSTFPGYERFEEELRARAARDDLSGAVDFLGYVEEPAAELVEADFVLVPSRDEPFGNVAVEAMLCGRPVVASAVQGLIEIIRDGVTGLLVPADDPPALAAALRALADEPLRALEMATAGREDAARRFSVERYRAEIAQLVLGVPSRAAGRDEVSLA